MSDDPFTLDLFGSSALSSGFGITAFGGFAPEAANDDEPDPTPSPPSPLAVVPSTQSKARKRVHSTNFYLQGDRGLAATWKERAQMNVAAILLASEIEKQERPARPDEQARLIRYTGFGASELANRVFRRPGAAEFREGWERWDPPCRRLFRRRTTPRSRAQRNMLISHRNSLSVRCGPV